MLAQAEGWRGLHQAQRGISARRVVQQASHALRRMGDVLGGTLAPPDFVRMAAAAVDALAERAGGDFERSKTLQSLRSKPAWPEST